MKLVLGALLLACSTAALASDDDALKQGAGSAAVVAELEEPDGVGVDLSDPGNWRIYALGTSTYDFDDADSRNDACTEATLVAKAKLAHFLNEELTSSQSMDKVVTREVAQATGSGRQATKDSITQTVTSIRSTASALLRGVITVDTKWAWRGEVGECRVKIGQSQKTLAMAAQVRDAIQGRPKAEAGSAPEGDGKQETKSDW